MYKFIRPLLFKLNPERAHHFTLRAMQAIGAIPPVRWLTRQFYHTENKPVTAFGLTFNNPVGLAAGYDKDAYAWRGLATLGFGHIEVGTITVRAQPGNPKPRVFRLVEDQAVINRMGFPGLGADYAFQQLQRPRPKGLVLGINLGMNKETPLENAQQDYIELMERFHPLGDYLAINISSPNTVGLRRLQGREYLESLLKALGEKKRELDQKRNKSVPLLVKLAPDLSDQELEDALNAITGENLDGVIATNTTITRPVLGSAKGNEIGGLSGAPLTEASTKMIRKIHKWSNGELPIIGVGGIMTPADAQAKLDAGATLVQVYSGLIYHGPNLIKHLVNKLYI